MSTLYLRAGHHIADPGAVANGYAEQNLTIELRDMIAAELEALGICVNKDSDKDDLATDVAKIARLCKPDDILLDIHFNAATPAATGTECFVPLNANDREYNIANSIAINTANVLGIVNRHRFNGNRAKTEAQTHHGRLAVMQPNCINILWEVCFITNAEDLAKYKANKGRLAKTTAHILSNHII